MAGARGESILALSDGEEVRLLYTNRALAEAEQQLNQGILGVLRDFQDSGGGIHETAVLLQVGMRAARREANHGKTAVGIAEAYAVMDDLGFAATITAVMEGVSAVLGYGAEGSEGGSGEDPDAPPA